MRNEIDDQAYSLGSKALYISIIFSTLYSFNDNRYRNEIAVVLPFIIYFKFNRFVFQQS